MTILFIQTILFSGCFDNQDTNTDQEVDKIQEKDSVQIIDIEIESQNLQKGEFITANVTVKNCSYVDIFFTSFPDSNYSLRDVKVSPTKIDENHYRIDNIGGFEDNILCYVIFAIGYKFGIDVEDLLVYVGDTEGSDISSLDISNIEFDFYPHYKGYSTSDNIGILSVEITSNFNIIKVKASSYGLTITKNKDNAYVSHTPVFVDSDKFIYDLKIEHIKGTHQWATNIGKEEVITEADDKFYSNIPIEYVYYRIYAQDESGKIAVSSLYNYISA